MRPVYENDEDRSNEEACAAYIKNRNKGCSLYRLPRLSCFDYVVCKGGNSVCFLEIKCRKNTKHKYPTYMISKKKFDVARETKYLFKIPTILFVRWADQCGLVTLDKEYEVSYGGRVDRNDKEDMEEVIHIDVNLFT